MFKRTRLQFTIRNYSRFAKDTVWENAQDLEHVPTLHSRTNSALTILATAKNDERHYSSLAFHTRRRLVFFPYLTFGFRKILADYQLHQIEYLPVFGMTVALNSIVKDTNRAGFLTEMIDEVIIEGPFWLKPCRGFLEWNLRRHTRIQCEEDEPYRARREELRRRKIELPFRFFQLPTLEMIARRFRETPC